MPNLSVTIGADRGTNATTATSAGHTFLIGATSKSPTNGPFSITATGAPPLFYQWKRGQTNVPDAVQPNSK